MPAFDFPASPTVGQTYDTGAGVIYVWDGVAWKGNSSGNAPMANSQRVLVYPTPGTFSYVKPAGLKSLQVEIWGGGGGSQGAGATAAATVNASGGGGGGAYCRKLYNASELAASEPLVVGAGGVGAVGAVAPAIGGNSTFKGMAATGGGPGNAVPASAISTTPGDGYALRAFGGLASGGDVNADGGGSWNAQIWGGNPLGGMGGLAGGPSAGMTPTRPPSGGTTQVARLGTIPGGGASGSALSVNQPAADGALGGNGMAILTEYYNEPDESVGSVYVRKTGDDEMAGILTAVGFTLNQPVAGQSLFNVWQNDLDFNEYAWRMNGPEPRSLVLRRYDGLATNLYRNIISLAPGTGVDATVIMHNLTMQQGIIFPAAQVNSADPNTLDDYEEGSWTPVIEGMTAAGVGTYTTQVGRYTKIGRMVFVDCNCVWTAHTGTGGLRMTGLPFSSAATYGPSFPMYCSGLTFTGQVMALLASNSTQISFPQLVTNASPANTPMDTVASAAFSGCYHTT